MMYACIFLCLFCLVTKLCPALFATLWTVTHQPPLSMGFFKHEYWNGLPFPSPGLTQGSNSCLLHGRWILYHWAPRVACLYNTHIHFSLSLSVQEKGTTEDEMAGWHHWLYGRESEWTPGVGDGQGGLACCDSWGHKESDTTELLNWTEWMLAIWSLVPLPFLNPAWTSGSSQFMYCWNLAWIILSISLLGCEMSTIVR